MIDAAPVGRGAMALRPCKECKKEISSEAKVCPHCGKKQHGSIAGVGCLIIIGLLVFAGYFGTQLNNNPGGNVGTNMVVDTKQAALSGVKISFKWRKAGFDNVMEADFVVKNDSRYNIKDFEIKCVHFAKSGTEIDSNTRTIYEIVEAHSTKKFPHFNMGFIHSQVASSSCAIDDLTIVP
jgi:hypothetical protein